MRIAYFTGDYARASDTFIRNEVVDLRARGHEVDTFSIRRPNEPGPPSAEVAAERASTCYILSVPKVALAKAIVRTTLTRPGRAWRALVLAMRVSPTGLRPRAMHFIYWAEATYLASRLLERRIQVLHNHIAENSATVAMLASEISGIPFSMTVHGPGIFWHPARWALSEKIARAAFTACISEFCKSQCMVHSRLADWPKLKVIRCGVGREFERIVASPPPAAPRLLFVGRLCQEKGLPLLMEAMARFVRGGGRCELVVIGDGPLMPYVRSFVDDNGLRDSVKLLGWCGSAEVAAELAQSRALVLPSLAEGLPVVIMEALAAGRPVITTAIAGIPELVRPDNGWIVAPGSVDELVSAITAATSASVEALQAMGLNGAARVHERHALTTEVDKLEFNLRAVASLRP